MIRYLYTLREASSLKLSARKYKPTIIAYIIIDTNIFLFLKATEITNATTNRIKYASKNHVQY
jgi:hypothetical protein